jgi:NADPH2:quinone reductase
VVCKQFGGPELLELSEVDEPHVGAGEILIDVKACAVTFPDLLMLHDKYQFKPGLPFVPGTEVAGVVRDVGPGVEGFSPGERVAGSCGFAGGMAERAAVRAATAVKVPVGVGLEQAAGLLYAYGTAQYALCDRGSLAAGETLLVLGAAGAVGLASVEIGRLLGARVVAAASTPEKLRMCVERGADDTVDYSREDLKARVRELTDGQGADVVFDPVGGQYAEAALRATAWGGRYLVIGFAAGEIPRLPLNLTLLRGCSIVGVFWGSFAAREPERHRANVAQMVSWWKSGQLRPHVFHSYPLGRASDALSDLVERRVVGKVVVVPS